MIIGVDVDDVCLNLVTAWLYKYNTTYKDRIKTNQIKKWDIASYCTKCTEQQFYDLLTGELYETIEPMNGALSGVNKLRNFGRVVFVTSNFADIGRPKFNALNRLGFNVDKKDYYEASDKSIIATHFLVDDNYDNVLTAHGQGVLFSRPWNENIDFSPRVDNWDELIGFMRGDFA